MRAGIPDDVITSTHGVRLRVQAVRGGSVLDEDVKVFSAGIDWRYDNNVPALVGLRLPLDYVPRSPLDPMAPFGQRLFISQVLTVGSDEYVVNLGQYLITDVTQQGSVCDVQARSLEYLILDARLTSPIKPASTYAATLRGLCRGIVAVDTSGRADRSLSSSLTAEWADDNDRMSIMRDLERTWPALFMVDDDGILVVTPYPSVKSTPDVQWVHGKANSYVETSSGSTREEVYNAFVQRGETADGRPIQSMAYDNDSSSPTYYRGPFGQRPRFAFSPVITTWQQARDAAQAGLRRELIRTARVTVTAPPDPRIQVHDTAQVTTQDGTVARGRVIEIGLPLTPDAGAARYVIGDVVL